MRFAITRLAPIELLAPIKLGTGTDLCLLVDLAWCRYTRYGWYESGGKFLKVVSET
jgi:hypothetical protein